MDLDAQRLLALEQDLRRDLDAVERVRKMMAFKNGAIRPAPDERQIDLIPPPAEKVEEEYDQNLADIPSTSLRGTIETIINKEPNTRWTVQKMVSHLTATGFELKAQKPVFSVGQAMKKLADTGRIRLVRRGSGSEPNLYKGKVEQEVSTG